MITPHGLDKEAPITYVIGAVFLPADLTRYNIGMQATNQSTRRPVSVVLLTLICFCTTVYAAYLAYDAFAYAQSLGTGPLNEETRIAFIRSLVLVPVLGALSVGLWRLQPWARTLCVALLVLAIGSTFVSSLLNYPLGVALAVAVSRSAIPGGLLLFLLHPVTKAVFGSRR